MKPAMGSDFTSCGIRFPAGALWKSEDCWDVVSVQWGVCARVTVDGYRCPGTPSSYTPTLVPLSGLSSVCVGRSVSRAHLRPGSQTKGCLAVHRAEDSPLFKNWR